jgi:tRNA nucleotidyltransferase (CCA-adding enzyme)
VEKLKQIASWLEKRGIQLYIVGGAVRDEIMGNPVEDVDICVVGGITAEIVQTYLEAFKPEVIDNVTSVHGDFPIWIVEIDGEKYEFAMARKERKTGQSHQEFSTEVRDVTIEEDLMRRDFTMNAIAKNLITGEIIDPYDGQYDIHHKILRPVSAAFTEDPLRVIRAARFMSRFEFHAAPSLIMYSKMMNKDEIKDGISEERVGIELMKTMKTASKPSYFFEFLKEVGWLNPWFKEVADLIGVPQSPKHHPEGDVWVHTMKTIDVPNDWFFRTVMLCHDLGKATHTIIHGVNWRDWNWRDLLTPDYKISSAGHEEAGVELTRNMLQRIHFTDHATIRKIACLVELHMTRGVISEKNYDKICRRTLRRLMKYDLDWMSLVKVTQYDLCGREPRRCPELHEVMADMYTSHIVQLKNNREMIPIVDGEKLLALGLKEGPEMGRIIKHALELQDRGTLKKDNWLKVLKGAGYQSLQNVTT